MSYDISRAKAKDLKDKLRADLEKIIGENLDDRICRFRCLFLLDDFSGSGKSYLRLDAEGKYEGKIGKVFNNIKKSESPLSEILDRKNLLICVLLYMATEQAIKYLKPLIRSLFQDNGYRYELLVIQQLDEKIKVQKGLDSDFFCLADKYYDPKVETEATRVGGTGNVKFGFANCSLPLVLSHNTPNNSIRTEYADMEISVGDFILTGGELPAMIIIEVVSRLIPGVLGGARSNIEESFEGNLLEYPQYTRPRVFHGQEVPPVLLSGDHEKIRLWRRTQSIKRTLERRLDLLNKVYLSEEDKAILKEIKREQEKSELRGKEEIKENSG
jgi:hypothetical protein